MLEPGSPLREQADQVLVSAERASWLTRSLVEFGSRKETRRSAQDLNTVIRHAGRFLPGLLSRDITLRIAPSPERLVVNMDTNKIERVLMNLAVNARDAMPDGGTVTIETGTAEIDAVFIQKHGCGKAGAYAFFSLSDTGVGMDETLRKRIFEPFFTTKTALKATGFGLSIAYDIVKEHGGYITVASAPDKGSVFAVYLPLVSREGERTMPA
jgi:signal transduction histidine kinase